MENSLSLITIDGDPGDLVFVFFDCFLFLLNIVFRHSRRGRRPERRHPSEWDGKAKKWERKEWGEKERSVDWMITETSLNSIDGLSWSWCDDWETRKTPSLHAVRKHRNPSLATTVSLSTFYLWFWFLHFPSTNMQNSIFQSYMYQTIQEEHEKNKNHCKSHKTRDCYCAANFWLAYAHLHSNGP